MMLVRMFATRPQSMHFAGRNAILVSWWLCLLAALGSCSSEQEPLVVTTVQSASLGDRRPAIDSVWLRAVDGRIFARTDDGNDFVFEAQGHSLLDARAVKVSPEIWCVLGISGTDDIIALYPLRPNNVEWTISAETSTMKSFKEKARLLQGTFCVFPDSTAIIVSDSNEVYKLYFDAAQPMRAAPYDPDLDATGRSKTQRSLFFGSFNFSGVTSIETEPIGDDARARLRRDTEFGNVAELTNPKWKYKYWIWFAKVNPVLERIMVYQRPLDY